MSVSMVGTENTKEVSQLNKVERKLKFDSEVDRPQFKEETYLETLAESTPTGKWLLASEYMAAQPPIQAEACELHQIVDCATCKLICPICKGMGCEHMAPAPPIVYTEEMKQWFKKPLLKVFKRPQTPQVMATVQTDDVLEPESPFALIYRNLEGIAWNAAARNLWDRWSEDFNDRSQRVKDAKSAIMAHFWGIRDKILAADNPLGYAWVVAENLSKNTQSTAYQRHNTPASQIRYQGSDPSDCDYYEAPQESLNELAYNNSFAGQAGAEENRFGFNVDLQALASDKELWDLLEEAMSGLPLEQQWAVNAYTNPKWWPDGIHGLNYREVAETMNRLNSWLPPGTRAPIPYTESKSRRLIVAGLDYVTTWFTDKGIHVTTRPRLEYGPSCPKPLSASQERKILAQLKKEDRAEAVARHKEHLNSKDAWELQPGSAWHEQSEQYLAKES